VRDAPDHDLDPAGVQWIRGLMKRLAAEGRTVLVSSHLMNEMAVTADHLVIIAKGRLVADCPTAEFIVSYGEGGVFVRSPQALRLIELLARQGAAIRSISVDTFEVAGMEPAEIADLAAANGLAVHELTPRRGSLEEAFMRLTADMTEYTGSAGSAGPSGAPAAPDTSGASLNGAMARAGKEDA
jgi:ABC-2 type transport system ATP-binding protein